MKKFLVEFKKFALRGNVMELAIGIIIGAAFQAIIQSLVTDVVSPLIGLVANTDFKDLVISIGDVNVRYGSFITAVINFLIMALIIFVFVKVLNKLESLGKKNIPDAAAKPTVKKCPYCCTEIDIDASRCPHCTSVLDKEA